jgi:hypothetical protein
MSEARPIPIETDPIVDHPNVTRYAVRFSLVKDKKRAVSEFPTNVRLCDFLRLGVRFYFFSDCRRILRSWDKWHSVTAFHRGSSRPRSRFSARGPGWPARPRGGRRCTRQIATSLTVSRLQMAVVSRRSLEGATSAWVNHTVQEPAPSGDVAGRVPGHCFPFRCCW